MVTAGVGPLMQLNRKDNLEMEGKHVGKEWEAEPPMHTFNLTYTLIHTCTHFELGLNFADRI